MDNEPQELFEKLRKINSKNIILLNVGGDDKIAVSKEVLVK
jgi:hypothetical protein